VPREPKKKTMKTVTVTRAPRCARLIPSCAGIILVERYVAMSGLVARRERARERERERERERA